MSSNTDSLVGREFDGYRVEEVLGRGGMARVYRAVDLRLKRPVAIKIIDPDVRDPQKYQSRFDREARAIAKLKHTHIVSIYRFNEVDGLYYMAMEYVDGADLRWVLRNYRNRHQRMDWEMVLQIAIQIASALDYAHRNEVIHRDIKPSNIMIDRKGNAILTDFGLVLMTSEGTVGEIFGSPYYIAPEQAVNSANVVPQSDLYALGVVVYEMLTGDVPFSEGTPMEVAMAHMSDTLPSPVDRNPALHPAYVPVLEKALAKSPEHRYQTGKDFTDALKVATKRALKESPKSRRVNTKPATLIAENIQPVKQPDTDQLPSIPPAPPSLPKDGVQAAPAKQRRGGGRLLLVLLLVIVLAGAGVVAYTQLAPAAPPTSSPLSAAIEGRIDRLDERTLHIFDLPVTLEDDDFWAANIVLQEGDMLRIEGRSAEQGQGMIFEQIDALYVNGTLRYQGTN